MTRTRYTWNPLTDSVIEETGGVGNVLATYTNKPLPFGPLVSQNRAGTTSVFHFDAIGSSRLLTDDLQETTDSYSYTAWGVTSSSFGPMATSRAWVGRVGYQVNSTTFDYYVRARYYSPSIARWSSRDPLEIGSLASYSYSTNSPAKAYDPTGCSPADPGWTETCDVTCGNNGAHFGLIRVRPVTYHHHSLPWTYLPIYQATGIGMLMYFVLEHDTYCCCDSYRFIQVVHTNQWDASRRERPNMPAWVDGFPNAIDPYFPDRPIPLGVFPPGYDVAPAGTVASLYDLPGQDGIVFTIHDKSNKIVVHFQTCIVCQRSGEPDSSGFITDRIPNKVLSCVSWGYERTVDPNEGQRFKPGTTYYQPQCTGRPTGSFLNTVRLQFPDYFVE